MCSSDLGMMLSGTVYQLPQFALTPTEIGSGLWPTPNAADNRGRGCMEDEAIKRRIRIGKQVGLSTAVKETRQSGTLNPTWVEWLMGFPLGHTDLDA